MLESVGIHLPNYRVRDITTELSEKEVRDVSKAEFARLCQELTRQDVSRTFKTSKQHDRDAVKIQGEMGATHLVLNEVGNHKQYSRILRNILNYRSRQPSLTGSTRTSARTLTWRTS